VFVVGMRPPGRDARGKGRTFLMIATMYPTTRSYHASGGVIAEGPA